MRGAQNSAAGYAGKPRRLPSLPMPPAPQQQHAGNAAPSGAADHAGKPRRPPSRPMPAAPPAKHASERSAERRRRPRRETEPVAEGLSRLFVSIGRNRRVLPDDLAELISDSVTVERSELGVIRVLDSYSFVEVPEAVAEDTITALSGTSFKGRRITVDFARAKT